MKFNTLVASAAFAVSTAALSSAALAGQVDFSGSTVNMNAVEVGQFGTISNLYQTLFTLPPNVVGTGSIFGFLPSFAQITFSYSFTGLSQGNLKGNTSYNYFVGADQFEGGATTNTSGATTSSGTINNVNSAPLVFASSGLNIQNPGTSTGSVTFTNTSASFAQFQSIFTGLLAMSPSSIGSATYAVSSIPLPAALPMFATLMASMFGFARFGRKRKALAA